LDDLLDPLDLFHEVCHEVYHEIVNEVVQKEVVQTEVVQTKVQKLVHTHAHARVRDPVSEVEAIVALPNVKDLVLLKKQLVLLFLFFVV
jgi:hypothetical protein